MPPQVIMSVANTTKCWIPVEAQESRKLSDDRGCHLASGTVTSRTRDGSVRASSTHVAGDGGNANAANATNAVGDDGSQVAPIDLFLSPSTTSASTLTADTACTPKGRKTTSLMRTRATFEAEAIRSLESYLVCPTCQSSIEVETPTVGIASGIRLKCRNDFCSFLHIKRPQSTNFDLPASAGSPLITRTTDFAVNILFVLSMLCSGDGPTEAGRVIGWCGLPTQQRCRHAILAM